MATFKHTLMALGVAGTALSANAAVAQGYDWEGFYAGAHLGGAAFAVETSDLTDTFTNDAPPIEEIVPSYGVLLDYNWVPYNDALLIGLELDATWGLESDLLIDANGAGTDGLEFESTINTLIALRGRVGMVNGRLLSFISAGPAFAQVDYVARELDPVSDDCGVLVCAQAEEDLTGITFGAGMEYAVTDDITARFEFMHYELPSTDAPVLTAEDGLSCTGGTSVDECTAYFDSSATLFRIGVSYKF